MSPAQFDLAAYKASRLTLISEPHLGEVAGVYFSWPIEFEALDGYVAPEPVLMPIEEISIVISGQDRLIRYAQLVCEVAENAEARGGWDWDKVNELLLEACKILPSHLISIDHEQSSWTISPLVGESWLQLLEAPARIIASHALNNANADVQDLSDAWEAARKVVPSASTPTL